MPKSNYGQVKRQKEAARKAKQQKKLERRQSRGAAQDVAAAVEPGTAAAIIPDGERAP